MTDNEIVKALECCTRGRKGDKIPCTDCSYDECNIVGGTSERQTSGTCQSWLMKDALDLINRQKAEIERLKERDETRHKVYMTKCEELEIAKSEAIKEFAERLKIELTTGAGAMRVSTLGIIDTLVKEMVGSNSP